MKGLLGQVGMGRLEVEIRRMRGTVGYSCLASKLMWRLFSNLEGLRIV